MRWLLEQAALADARLDGATVAQGLHAADSLPGNRLHGAAVHGGLLHMDPHGHGVGHVPHVARGGGSSASWLIFLLVTVHVVGIGYWAYYLYQQRKAAVAKKETSDREPPKSVNCVYEWSHSTPLVQMQPFRSLTTKPGQS